ncbi:MAG: hypothetical protein K0S93_504 [Nitrososphaeraceae archaeon]|jgi:hypothetical protein|nr:hypothetical protein [Nitrososphaeraceae archaeon]
METEPEQKPKVRKRPFKRRTLQMAPCCWCGVPTECIHKTKTLKCWDCRMKMIKDYQYAHNAMNTYHQYL